ncbi:uncharacterized protein LOC134838355 [Culicoides brevitarsis]|uniref:uncharacterized protein LOC134838355 n=1 Tax=Culicoides brevitarsis TaxID=469753 RepID=UPI00307CADE6
MSKYIQLDDITYKHKNSKFLVKCLLLSISLLVFVYLLINSINYHKKYSESNNENGNELKYELARQLRLRALLEQRYRAKWNYKTVHMYKIELGLEMDAETVKPVINETQITKSVNTTTVTNHTTNQWHDPTIAIPQHLSLACAFPGNSLHDQMWEYLSMFALQQQFPENIFATLSVKTHNRLVTLLQTINMTAINKVASHYDLANARIMGHTTPVLPEIEVVEGKRVPLLLEKFAKRHGEIINANVTNFRQFFQFGRRFVAKGMRELHRIKLRYGFNETDDDLQYVGVYIDKDTTMPLKYFANAFSHFLEHNSRTLFLVFCSPDAMSHYNEDSTFHLPAILQPFQSNTYLTTTTTTKGVDAEIMEFILMSLCNATIVSNTYGALQALLNGGNATFGRPDYSSSTREYFIPYIMGQKIANWVEIT